MALWGSDALAVELVERRVDAAVTLQKLLGHSSMLVTSRLLDGWTYPPLVAVW